ncbi:MAG: NHLP bacteriocin system secretion protein [Microcystaceae cyanobacterium]
MTTSDQKPQKTETPNGQEETKETIIPSQPFQPHLIFRLLPTFTLIGLTGWWSVVGRIPTRVIGQSILIQPRSIISFQPRGSGGQILEIRIKPGDKVKAGQVIAVLDLPDVQEQLRNQQEKLAEYEAENLAITNAQNIRSNLQQQTLQLESVSIPQQLEANLKEIEANRIKLIAVEKQRQAYEERIAQLDEFIELTQRRFQAYNKLVEEGAIAPLSWQIVNSENQVQVSRNERTSLYAQLENLSSTEEELDSANINLNAQNEDLKAQLEKLRTDSANLRLTDLQANVQRQNTIDNLRRDIDNLRATIAKDSLVISAYNGTVVTISGNVGEYIQVGTALGTLRVDNSNTLDEENKPIVTTYAFFTPEDANRIRQGMTGEVTPHLLTNRRFGGVREEYGSIPSTVMAVSSKTVTVQEVASIVGDSDLANALVQNPVPYTIPDNGRAQNLPVVQVELKLEQNLDNPSGYEWTHSAGPDTQIVEGALGEVRVTVQERSLMSYAMASLRWITGIYRS